MARPCLLRLLALALVLVGGIALLPLATPGHFAGAQDLDVHPAHTHTGSCVQPGEIVSVLSPVSSAYEVDGQAMVVPEIVGSAPGVPVEYSSTILPVALSQILTGQ